MKFQLKSLSSLFGVALAVLSFSQSAYADKLDDIKKSGVLRAAVFDSNPPFGSVDAKSHKIVGYDIDFAEALAKKIGVKLELVATNPANRIPLLQSGKVDLIVADITITAERAKVIDFSYPYFVTGQQFLVASSAANKLDAFAEARIGAVKGTTGEQELHVRFPKAQVVAYDDVPLALTALRNGSVKAITQDSSILVGLLSNAGDKKNFQILPEYLSTEHIGVGAPKGEKALLNVVNSSLLELEKNGEAAKIHERWFGKHSAAPEPRNFKIVAQN
ncbi:ABC transporter substrate-binding protein [Undibacterium sp. CY21W]|uniref:ABC transporter substrate-binding protein n=1 Tax=Undibacterium sp. CY21W TaxID=2762293 RepID=UPI00164CD1DA|nr:ABC transporter substrate-binding protein [Undibacterium sp. CY21W]MBC3929499.1 ABC transporter substrate-binding protein [Undibacterium sp. CY21W]